MQLQGYLGKGIVLGRKAYLMAEALETLLVKVPELDHDVHERVLARLADRVDEAVRSRMSGVGDLGFEAHKSSLLTWVPLTLTELAFLKTWLSTSGERVILAVVVFETLRMWLMKLIVKKGGVLVAE